MRSLFLLPVMLLSFLWCPAQQNSSWTLQQCIQYALEHNLTIKQNELNKRLAQLQLDQSEYARLPNLNLNTSYGRSFGRSIDPTTNQFINTNYGYVNMGGSGDFLLFGWFQKKHKIEQNQFNLKASEADYDQAQSDVSLNIANGYLRVLLAREQISISNNQVKLSEEQLKQTSEFVKSGRLPELNLAQLESQLATDSANLITAISNYQSSILDMKALLNFDFATPFAIAAPEVSLQDYVNLASLDAEKIFDNAKATFGSVKSAQYKIDAAIQGMKGAKGSLYPQLAINFQTGSSYASTYKDIIGADYAFQESQAYVTVNGIRTPIYQPVVTRTYTRNTPLGKQLSNNFRQTVSLVLSIPIFNGWQAQYNYRQAKVNILSQELNKEQTEITLKQNIYKAINDAQSSLQKYYAAQRAATAAGRAYDFAQKRYDLGLTNTVEYLTTKNTQFSSDANLASAKYDLIFRLKVIDYYMGKEIKL